jgi:uncharacterized membrane protein (UPF0182 family)
MPELRLVVLALQDRLAYGPTFESAMQGLFGGGISSTSAPAAAESGPRETQTANAAPPATDLNSMIKDAAKNLSDYQRLTAEGKLGEAGQKLEQLKIALDRLNARQK